MTTYLEYLDRVIRLRTLRGPRGQALVGTFGVLADALAQGWSEGLRAPWIGDVGEGPAYDALGPAGSELSMPRYPGESWTQYHERLQRAWTDYRFAGTEATIEAQLAAAGFPGARVLGPNDTTIEPPGYWSHFIVYFPIGSHTVTASAPKWGSFKWGDGTQYGPVGLSAQQLQTIRAIVRKWKPGHWICRELVFQIAGWQYGTGRTWGEIGLKWGGESARVTGE